MKKFRKMVSLVLTVMLLLALAACGRENTEKSVTPTPTVKAEEPSATPTQAADPTGEPTTTVAPEPTGTVTPTPEPVAKNGEIVILFTSDIHCGIDQGFGFAGLAQIRDTLEAQGYTTILVDDGDAIQGESVGTISKGETIVNLMNEIGYDVAIPGNHEFDYGMERFLELAKTKANYKYISCNFNKQGELVFDPYVIIEACGKKIAFVGVTTPKTVNTSTPAYFQNENGEYIYGFFPGQNGEELYSHVQKAVDDARAEGADYVYVMGHLGNEAESIPYTYMDVIANTTGIDVFLDGHSHDTDQIVMKNKNGESVTRSAVGTKFSCIGYSRITADGIEETGVWRWPNKTSAVELLNIENPIAELVKKSQEDLADVLTKVVATSSVELTIYDPEAKDENENPIRMVRRAETNIGDFCADALRDASGADVAVINGGGIRKSISKGDITYRDIINVFPFGNQLCVLDVTGQQILDALEWSVREMPGEHGGFLQVSGMSFEIDVTIPSPCKADDNNMCIGFGGARRIRNVKIGDEPLDSAKHYTLAGINYTLLDHGDGYTAFDGAELLQDRVKIDNQLLIDYIIDTLGGVIGETYADPRGEGRIKVIE